MTPASSGRSSNSGVLFCSSISATNVAALLTIRKGYLSASFKTNPATARESFHSFSCLPRSSRSKLDLVVRNTQAPNWLPGAAAKSFAITSGSATPANAAIASTVAAPLRTSESALWRQILRILCVSCTLSLALYGNAAILRLPKNLSNPGNSWRHPSTNALTVGPASGRSATHLHARRPLPPRRPRTQSINTASSNTGCAPPAKRTLLGIPTGVR